MVLVFIVNTQNKLTIKQVIVYNLLRNLFTIYRAHILLFPCNALLAEKCFATLFDQMPDICINSEPSLRCHHFTYLDQCLEGVGECTAYTIGNAAKLAYQTRLTDCRLRTDVSDANYCY
jgi:hypothetical protein